MVPPDEVKNNLSFISLSPSSQQQVICTEHAIAAYQDEGERLLSFPEFYCQAGILHHEQTQ